MRRCVAILLATGLTACQPAASSSEEAVQALKAADAQLSQAVASKGLDKIVFFYADDAVMLPAAEPLIEGKMAIREEWEHVLAIPDFSSNAQLRGAQVSSSGDLGYTWGTYRARMMGEDGKPAEEPGKFLTVWKRGTDGRWQIVMDTYNTDIPPPDHK